VAALDAETPAGARLGDRLVREVVRTLAPAAA